MTVTRKEIFPAVSLTYVPMGQLRTGLISIHLLTPLRRESAAQAAVLPYVLRHGTITSPDMTALSARLDELFGAQIECSVRKLGQIQGIGFIADFVENVSLQAGSSLAGEIIALLGEMFLQPVTRGGLLMPEYVNCEQEKLLQVIRAKKNDREEYACSRLLKLMCLDEPCAVDPLGDEKTAKAIDYVALTKYYKKILASSPMEIFYCGREEYGQIEEAVKKAFISLPRGELNRNLTTNVCLGPKEEYTRFFSETMDVSQGKLVLGYRLGRSVQESDSAAWRVMECMLGGEAPCSKLFTNVREKDKLCYYIDSELDLMNGIMLISTGIDSENFDDALNEIQFQVGQMKKGKFTTEELSAARLILTNYYLGVLDSPEQLERYWLAQNILGQECGPQEMAALVSEVKAEDVKLAAAGLKCDAVFFLSACQEEKMQRIVWQDSDLIFYKGKLANRLPLYVVPRPGRHRIWACLLVHYGSADRSFLLDGQKMHTPAGTAHFLEHEMFNTNRGSVDAIFNKRGAFDNAFTAEGYTCYYFECTDQWQENLQTLMEFVCSADLPSEAVAKEREIIAQEIAETEDDPEWAARVELMKCLFGNYPLGDDVVGTRKSIGGISEKLLRQCYRTFYTSGNMCLCVMGDVDPQTVEELVSRTQSEHWKPLPSRVQKACSLVPEKSRAERTMDVSVPQFCAGLKLADGEGKQCLKQRLTAELAIRCFWGNSAPAYRELYEEGLVNDTFHTESVWASGIGSLLFEGESSDPEKVFSRLTGAVGEKINASFFQRQKKALLGDYLRALDDDEDLAYMLAEGTFLHFSPEDFPAVLEKLTGTEVSQWAEENLTADRFALAVVQPGEGKI